MRGSTRRRFLGLAGAAALSRAAEAKTASGRPPNFVVILADDLGWGDLVCYGSQRNETPELDRMAAEGARFTSAYATAPVCAPTRASLLTGRYPFRHGLAFNPAPDEGINDYGLATAEITLAEVLKAGGYRSAAIGKWHLGHIPRYLPALRGSTNTTAFFIPTTCGPCSWCKTSR